MKVASHISWQKILHNIYIIDEEKDSIIKIDDIAALIWQMINEQKHDTDIAEKICKEYDVQYEEALFDVSMFIDDMVNRRYLER